MHELENFTINVKLITDMEQITPLHDGVRMEIEEYSFFDALCSALNRSAKALLEIDNKPKEVILEASGQLEEEDEISFLQGHVLYEKFRWKKVDSTFPMFNESGEEPFSIEYHWVKPSLFEEDIINYLSIAFPDFKFKYFDEAIQINISGKWIDIFDYFRNLPKDQHLDFHLTTSNNMTERARKAEESYMIISTLIKGMRDKFFKSFNEKVEITKMVSFREIYDKTEP
ncbi:MAG: hypothetical protein K9L68_12400 [Spirochaetales bacterium]|nr:hypothetical protein [Spirochaetales bacterium]